MLIRFYILCIFLCPYIVFSQANINKYIFRIEVFSKQSPKVIVQTGFKIKGQREIITSLHGVATAIGPANRDVRITAVFHDGSELKLKVLFVNEEEDIAFLYNDSIQYKVMDGEGLELGDVNKLFADQTLTINGYSCGMNPNDTKVQAGRPVLTKLKDQVTKDFYNSYKERGNPLVTTDVLSLIGKMNKGQSGAPVLTKENKVVGFMGAPINGSDACWAVMLTSDKLAIKYPIDSIVMMLLPKLKKVEPTLLPYNYISKFNAGKPSLLSVGYRNNFVFEKGDNIVASTSFYMPSITAMLVLPISKYKFSAGIDFPFNYSMTANNTYETLKSQIGTTQVNYNMHIIRPFIRYSFLSNMVKHTFNPYIGFSYNYIRQTPVQATIESSNGNFEQERQTYNYWIPEGILGIRYVAKWYAFELEGSFKNFHMKSENFQFDYFGNADPIIKTSVIRTYTVSVNLFINCSFIHIYVPKTTRYYVKYEF